MFMSGRVYQWETNPQGSSNAAQRKLPEEVRGREVRIDLQAEAHRSKLHICKEQFAFLYLNIEYFETRMQEAPPTGLCCYCIWNCELLVVSSVRTVTSFSKCFLYPSLYLNPPVTSLFSFISYLEDGVKEV